MQPLYKNIKPQYFIKPSTQTGLGLAGLPASNTPYLPADKNMRTLLLFVPVRGGGMEM